MSNDDSQLLMQASQIAGNLRERMVEQSRRESHIADQLASLDQEQRQLRLAQQQFEEDRQDRDAALKRREGEFAAKLADAEQLLTELQTREDEVERGHGQLEIARKRLAEELAHQLDVDRAALRHAKQLAEAERKDLAAQAEKLREDHQSLMRQVRRDLEVERRRVRAQTVSDIEAEQAAFEGQKAEWNEKKAREESDLKREAEVHRQAVVQIERDLAAERQSHLAEIERRKAALVALSDEERASVQRERDEVQNEIAATREELEQARQELEKLSLDAEATLAQRRVELESQAKAAHDAALAEVRTSWSKERDELRRQLCLDIEGERRLLEEQVAEFETRQKRDQAALDEVRETQEAALRLSRTELVEDRQKVTEELQLERGRHDASLTAARGQFEAEIQHRLKAVDEQLAEEKVKLEEQKLEHRHVVDKTTAELNEARNAFEQERAEWDELVHVQKELLADQHRETQSGTHTLDVRRQKWQAEFQRGEALTSKRQRQLLRFREVLSERERSLAREENVRQKAREQFQAELAADREKLTEERADLERQWKTLETAKSEQLSKLDRERQKVDERSSRLDRMRQELEQMSVVNLESRLAAEEAMAELMANVDERAAKERVEEVRAVVAGQFRQLQSTDGGSDKETARLVAIAQGRLEEEDERLRTDRDSFLRRMNERERELHEQEARLENRVNDWEQRESRWRHMRDDWLEEKLNAEQIIRSLLEELSTADGAAAA
jgi:hypothetical protein